MLLVFLLRVAPPCWRRRLRPPRHSGRGQRSSQFQPGGPLSGHHVVVSCRERKKESKQERSMSRGAGTKAPANATPTPTPTTGTRQPFTIASLVQPMNNSPQRTLKFGIERILALDTPKNNRHGIDNTNAGECSSPMLVL